MSKDKDLEFKDFVGMTFADITVSDCKDEVIFTLDNGDRYRMWHWQDCCESVYLEDTTGDLQDLIGVPILKADEVTNRGDVFGNTSYVNSGNADYGESHTWTFYHFATIKGYVTLRWYGSSNGYYSESVSLCKL